MKGILVNRLLLGGKTYEKFDMVGAPTPCPFSADKFYGGYVKRFGKTKEGPYLCMDGSMEVVDLFVDFDSLGSLPIKALNDIAGIIEVRKNAHEASSNSKDRIKVSKPKGTDKDGMIAFIRNNAVEIVSN